MKWTALFSMALVFSCTEKPSDTEETDDTEQDTNDTDSATDTSTPEQTWSNLCSGMPDDGHEILYAGVAYHESMAMNSELLITNQQEWDAFAAELLLQNLDETLPRDTFDWSSEHVAVLSVNESSTCGMVVLEADSCIIDAQAHLYLAVEDTSGGCETVCDAEGQVLLIVAKPTGDTSFNNEVIPGCE